MKFRTELKIKSSTLDLDPFGGLLFLGSCFSDNIGERFKSLGLPIVTNPFGVIFHPFPLLDLIETALQWGFEYDDSHLFEYEDRFYSLAHHGSYSGRQASELLQRMNGDLKILRDGLKQAKCLCLTFGTSWGYTREKKVVANCHQLPQSFFEKRLSSSADVESRINEVVEALLRSEKIDSTLKIMLTVSPVRHVKDGLIENNRSKAQLLSAVHTVSEQFEAVSYFPSYELVVDDLRDYRFFKADLVHPNEMAIDYVEEAFIEWVFGQDERKVLQELKKFTVFRNHLVKTEDLQEQLAHEALVEEKRAALHKKYPLLK